jgi:hypothetical protein
LLDPFGRLKSARLVLRAYLLPFDLWHNDYTGRCRAYTQERGGIKTYPDIRLDYDEDDWARKGEFYGLPITRQSFQTDFPPPGETIYTCLGLILERKDDGEFERVGLWECGSEKGYKRQGKN